MSDTEQQFMETSENGHEGDDMNGAEGYDEAQAGVDKDGDQNGANEGSQIEASKGEEDAGYVEKASKTSQLKVSVVVFVPLVFVGAMCRLTKGDGRFEIGAYDPYLSGGR